jgi:hypothetical protein
MWSVWLKWVVQSAACITGTGEITRGATDSLLRHMIAHTEGWRSFRTVISVAKLKIDICGCNLVKTDIFLPFCNITMSVTQPDIDVCSGIIRHNFFWCHTYSAVILNGFLCFCDVNLTHNFSLFLQYNKIYSVLWPFIPCLSRCAQSGRRTCFRRQVWFTESHMVLVIFFLLIYLFIHLFLI